jgi:hypothetical protein
MLRTRTLIPLLAVLAAALFAVPSSAATYCVNKPECVTAGGTDVGSDGAALSSALSTAQANNGADRVEIGPGSYTRAGGWAYTGAAGNPIDIVGAGSGQTTLTNTTTGPTVAITAANSSVKGLAAVLPPAASQVGVGVAGPQSVADDIAVTDQAGATNGFGANVGPGASLKHATITANGGIKQGVFGRGAVEDTNVALTGGTVGMNGPLRVERVAISGAMWGILTSADPSYQVDQAVIRVPSGAIGLFSASTNSTNVTTTADHLTIVGSGDATSQGVRAQASPSQTAHDNKVILRSSIVRGLGHDLSRAAKNGTADIEVDHSDFETATTLEDIQAGGSGTITDNGGNVDVDPQFVSTTDLRLQTGSPAIDAGASAVQTGESSTDLDGAARLFGSATDMGAFEYMPPPPPTPTPGPETTGTDGGTDAGASTETPGAVETPPAETPPVDTPPADPPVVPVKHKRSCAQIAKAKRGKKARAKAKSRCVRKHTHKTRRAR